MPKEKSKLIDTIKKVCPAVVSVVMSASLPKLRENLFFQFNQPVDSPIPQEMEDKKIKISGGSGFFFSPDGYILTNRHVVSEVDADYIVVTNDEKEYPAEVLAKDQINDIAILKIQDLDGAKLPFLKMGDSTDLELGQSVIAVGNVLGQFSNTVSTGIVSGLSRYIAAASGPTGPIQQLRGLIQTDAAVNPGNSGGPLVDINGEVIGINTAIVLGAQNIGFAIPISSAKKDLEEYKKYGRIRQPFFGVRHMILNDEAQKMFNLSINYGALVIREPMPGDIAVVPGSPADKAQIKERDIILEINNFKITEKKTIQDVLQGCNIGDEVSLKLLRGKDILTTKVKVEER